MKHCIYLLCGLCLAGVTALPAQTYPTQTILYNGPNEKRINLVFLSDGYRSSELGQFIVDVQNITNYLFTQPPFLQYKRFFNVYAVKVPSQDSDARHPGTATDVPEPASPILTEVHTHFSSTFDAGGYHRLLVPENSTEVFAVAAGHLPAYDQIILLVNSPVYGGSGGSVGWVVTASSNLSSNEIAVHEIGHSFAGLGDEYWFNCSECKNRTANNDPATIVWKNWLASNGVESSGGEALVDTEIGIFLIEGSNPPCYRPHQQCKMRALGNPFCAVCREAIIDRIYQLASAIDAFTPASTNVTIGGGGYQNFTLTLLSPTSNTQQVKWLLNGTTMATNTTSVLLTTGHLNPGANTLRAEVTDATSLSRAYWPNASGYLKSVDWTIQNPNPTANQYLAGDFHPNPAIKNSYLAVRHGNVLLMDTNYDNSHNLSQEYGAGNSEDQYLIGDWNADGRDNVGVRRGNQLLLDINYDGGHDIGYYYGAGAGESEYFVGDWDNNGTDNIGVRRGNQLLLDINNGGGHEIGYYFGNGTTHKYLYGDWDGDGDDNVAVRLGNELFMDYYNGGAPEAQLQFGNGDSECQYLVGDWDGDGADEFAVRRDNLILMDFGNGGDPERIQTYGAGTGYCPPGGGFTGGGLEEQESEDRGEAVWQELKTTSGRLFVYPNPVQEWLTVALPQQPAGSVRLHLLDLNGRLLQNLLFSTQSQQIDVSELPSGIYLLRLFDAAGIPVAVERIVKR